MARFCDFYIRAYKNTVEIYLPIGIFRFFSIMANMLLSLSRKLPFSMSLRPVSLRMLVFVFMLFYLTFHIFHGERGVFALWQSKHQLAEMEVQIAKATAEREALEHRVKALRGKVLDVDLLDEQARDMLSLSRPEEIVIVWPQQ